MLWIFGLIALLNLPAQHLSARLDDKGKAFSLFSVVTFKWVLLLKSHPLIIVEVVALLCKSEYRRKKLFKKFALIWYLSHNQNYVTNYFSSIEMKNVPLLWTQLWMEYANQQRIVRSLVALHLETVLLDLEYVVFTSKVLNYFRSITLGFKLSRYDRDT